MVEIFFSIITRQAIRRGTFTSVKDLIAAIETFIDGWNDRSHPFTWTKTPDDLLERCKPSKEPRSRDTRTTRLVRASQHEPAGRIPANPKITQPWPKSGYG
jgi:hypothetical protein